MYAVHCLEGKDRTGIVIALLECLMGADIDEVVDDYMTTFYNYYGVTRDDERYEIIADSNIRKSLKNMFGVSDLESADLSKCAEEYLAEIGMSSGNIETLENNLSADAEALSPAMESPQEKDPAIAVLFTNTLLAKFIKVAHTDNTNGNQYITGIEDSRHSC